MFGKPMTPMTMAHSQLTTNQTTEDNMASQSNPMNQQDIGDKENIVGNSPFVPPNHNDSPRRVSSSPIDNQLDYEPKSFQGSPSPRKISATTTITDVVGYDNTVSVCPSHQASESTRTAASAWVEGCGAPRPHSGGMVPEHRDRLNSELVTLRCNIHHSLGHRDTSPKPQKNISFTNM